MDEQPINEGLINGNPASLEEVMKIYGGCVYKLVSRMLAGTGSQSDIEECCSDTFVTVWKKRKQFDPDRAELRTWILMLARYSALDYRRKLAGKREAPCGEFPAIAMATLKENPEKVILDREKRNTVMQSLLCLPLPDREILYRRYFLEESVAQIAADLQITRGAADNRLWRARKALKQQLEEQATGKVVPAGG